VEAVEHSSLFGLIGPERTYRAMLGLLALRRGVFRGHDAGVDDSIVVEQFKALGDRVRWAIVRELQAGTRCACELSDVAEVSPTLLSHHLKVLREAGLIVGTKRGRWIDYTLDTDALAALLARAEPEAVAS
jgi:ArsR family transcriptional regulator